MLIRPLSANKLYSHAAAEFLYRQRLNEPYLSGAFYMRAAARAGIRARKTHYPHLARKLLFASVRYIAKLRLRRKKSLNIHVLPYKGVCLSLCLRELRLRDRRRKVYRNDVSADVKSDVFAAEAPVQYAGQDMLAGVLLHEIKAPRPVYLTAYGIPLRGAPARDVDYLAVTLARIRYRDDAYSACIARLSSALRIEGGAVESYLELVPARAAGDDRRLKFARMRIGIVEPSSHFTPLQYLNIPLQYKAYRPPAQQNSQLALILSCASVFYTSEEHKM